MSAIVEYELQTQIKEENEEMNNEDKEKLIASPSKNDNVFTSEIILERETKKHTQKYNTIDFNEEKIVENNFNEENTNDYNAKNFSEKNDKNAKNINNIKNLKSTH